MADDAEPPQDAQDTISVGSADDDDGSDDDMAQDGLLQGDRVVVQGEDNDGPDDVAMYEALESRRSGAANKSAASAPPVTPKPVVRNRAEAQYSSATGALPEECVIPAATANAAFALLKDVVIAPENSVGVLQQMHAQIQSMQAVQTTPRASSGKRPRGLFETRVEDTLSAALKNGVSDGGAQSAPKLASSVLAGASAAFVAGLTPARAAGGGRAPSSVVTLSPAGDTEHKWPTDTDFAPEPLQAVTPEARDAARNEVDALMQDDGAGSLSRAAVPWAEFHSRFGKGAVLLLDVTATPEGTTVICTESAAQDAVVGAWPHADYFAARRDGVVLPNPPAGRCFLFGGSFYHVGMTLPSKDQVDSAAYAGADLQLPDVTRPVVCWCVGNGTSSAHNRVWMKHLAYLKRFITVVGVPLEWPEDVRSSWRDWCRGVGVKFATVTLPVEELDASGAPKSVVTYYVPPPPASESDKLATEYEAWRMAAGRALFRIAGLVQQPVPNAHKERLDALVQQRKAEAPAGGWTGASWRSRFVAQVGTPEFIQAARKFVQGMREWLECRANMKLLGGSLVWMVMDLELGAEAREMLRRVVWDIPLKSNQYMRQGNLQEHLGVWCLRVAIAKGLLKFDGRWKEQVPITVPLCDLLTLPAPAHAAWDVVPFLEEPGLHIDPTCPSFGVSYDALLRVRPVTGRPADVNPNGGSVNHADADGAFWVLGEIKVLGDLGDAVVDKYEHQIRFMLGQLQREDKPVVVGVNVVFQPHAVRFFLVRHSPQKYDVLRTRATAFMHKTMYPMMALRDNGKLPYGEICNPLVLSTQECEAIGETDAVGDE